VVEQVVGEQAEEVEAVADLPQPRVHRLAEGTVDLLAALRPGQPRGQLRDRLVSELERALTLRLCQVLIEALGARPDSGPVEIVLREERGLLTLFLNLFLNPTPVERTRPATSATSRY
jgi:hypothetical protein